MVEPLVAENSIFHSRGLIGFNEFTDEERAAMPPVPQRLVRRHPGSGRKTLYLASHASHIVGWPVPDGMLLIRELIEHATQPEFVHRHSWRVGDLVIWDNRCTMHRGSAVRRDAAARPAPDHDAGHRFHARPGGIGIAVERAVSVWAGEG